jgi:hypothetical protein
LLPVKSARLYQKYGEVTTTIFLQKHPVKVDHFSSDSLPFLLYSLNRLAVDDEIQRRKELLDSAIRAYRKEIFLAYGAVDTRPGHSAAKDTMLFSATCSTHTMAGWCQRLLEESPHLEAMAGLCDMKQLILDRFWRGDHFINDVHSEPAICSADANFWPYWCGLFDDEDMLRKSVARARTEGLASPFPPGNTRLRSAALCPQRPGRLDMDFLYLPVDRIDRSS